MSTATIERTDTDLWLAVEDALDLLECAACEQLATSRLVIEPCRCTAPFCTDCRRLITRTYSFRARVDIPQVCQACKTLVFDIHWEAL